MKRRHGAKVVLIEDKGSGTQLIQDLKRGKDVRPIAIEADADKVTRMSNQSAKIEAGQVWLPERAAWLETFKAEMLAFPNSKFDDQVDSVSQFIWWAEDRVRRVARFSTVIGV
jgi:predicted phage terminase large subunit-like protein